MGVFVNGPFKKSLCRIWWIGVALQKCSTAACMEALMPSHRVPVYARCRLKEEEEEEGGNLRNRRR